jgi:hypothetical protein
MSMAVREKERKYSTFQKPNRVTSKSRTPRHHHQGWMTACDSSVKTFLPHALLLTTPPASMQGSVPDDPDDALCRYPLLGRRRCRARICACVSAPLRSSLVKFECVFSFTAAITYSFGTIRVVVPATAFYRHGISTSWKPNVCYTGALDSPRS